MLWLILLMLVIAKLLFNKWYPIVVENQKFINACNFIEKHNIIKYIIMLIFYTFSINFWYLTATKQKHLKNIRQFIFFNVVVIGTFTFKKWNNTLGSILKVVILVLIPVVLNLKRNSCGNKIKDILMPIVVYVLINAWQFTIYFVRDLDIETLTNLPNIISYTLMIDYYIFIIIQWIGVSFMGLFSGGWLFGKSEVELKALKDKELKKAKPDKELLKQIDECLAKKTNDCKK